MALWETFIHRRALPGGPKLSSAVEGGIGNGSGTMEFRERPAVYSTWTVCKLKEELTRRNARTSGRKSELVER